MASTPSAPSAFPLDAQSVAAIARCTAAIARLDARISVSSVAAAWHKRAAWSGYAAAIRLQGAELDEIDVFSWGCGVAIPGRAPSPTHLDWFDRFDGWAAALVEPSFWPTPASLPDPGGTAIVRAFTRTQALARADGSATAWLDLPFALSHVRLTARPLPCLVSGAKALRFKRVPDAADWASALRALERNAGSGLDRLDSLERLYRDAQRAIVAERRPGALPRLLAMTFGSPLLSPRSVAAALDITIAGAGKLLERAVAAGLVVEVAQRRSWRRFLTRDLAEAFGFAAPRRGRPAGEPPIVVADRAMADVLAAFDAEMAELDAVITRIGS